MNRDDVLDLFNGARDDYVLAAMESRKAVPRRNVGRKRMLQIAAVIAMTLLLVGCGVVYVLKMQDLKLGDQQVTQERWDAEQNAMVSETVQQQVLTFSGLKGTPNYEAAKEWYEFEKNYDPDHALYFQNDAAEVPWKKSAQYSYYNIYTQEMQAKIDEIIEKYGLKLIGAPVRSQSVKSMLSYLGLENVFKAEYNVYSENFNASYYEGGRFDIDMKMKLEDYEDWPYTFLCSLYYNPKDCFDDTLCELNEAQDWQEWNYTTASGDNVLVIRSPSVWVSWVFCDRGDATIALRMETILEWYSDDSVERISMPDEVLKEVLDTFDFSLRPTPGDPALLTGLPAGLDSAKQIQSYNGYTVEVKSAVTDGHTALIRLGLTMPEESAAQIRSKVPDKSPAPFFKNHSLGPVDEDIPYSHSSGAPNIREDGDGKDNTVEYLLRSSRSTQEGLPFPEGSTWNLYLEDLYVTEWNSAISQSETLWETEGVWSFDFTFDSSSDYRELEFISEPVKTKASVGWREDGSDVFEEVTLTSLKIRSFSGKSQVAERDYAELCDYRADKLPKLVLTDGTEIRMRGDWVANDPEWEDKPIPLDDVEYLELMDGQKLYPAEVTADRQEDFSLEVKSAVTDGRTAQIVLGLTVPYWAEMCQENCEYSVSFGNFGDYTILMPMDRDMPSRDDLMAKYAIGEELQAREDGDGRDDTVEIVYNMYVDSGQEAYVYFAPGSRWLFHIENMSMERLHYPEGELTQIEPLWTAPGVHNVEFTLSEGTIEP